MPELLSTISPRDKNAHTAYDRCIPYSETPLLVVGRTDVEGWKANESWNEMGHGMGWREWLFMPIWEKKGSHFWNSRFR